MIRSHESVVVYGDELTLPSKSIEHLESFAKWLASDLTTLEARWLHRAAPLARCAAQQDTHS